MFSNLERITTVIGTEDRF